MITSLPDRPVTISGGYPTTPFDQTLYISNTPILTVTVLPNKGGVVLPNGVTAVPGGAVQTASNINVAIEDSDQLILLFNGPTDTPLPSSEYPTPLSTLSSSSAPTETTTTAASSIPGSSKTSSSAATQTTSGSLSPTHTHHHAVLSKGAIAGIVIGCIIAVALVVGLLIWFFLGKSRQRGKGDQEASSVGFLSREKDANMKAHSPESGSPVNLALANDAPQPLEDKAISGEISKISNLVKNHVQSYYHSGRVSPGLLDFDELHSLGHDMPISTGTLSTLLGNSTTREIALRYCIAWVITSRMLPDGDPKTTFLPPEIADRFQTTPTTDRERKAQSLFMNKWRQLTIELTDSNYTQDPFSASDPRNHNIQAALEVLDSILAPYADSRIDNGQRRRNLEEILKRAATFAFTLFSQPSTWYFDWQEGQGIQAGSLCIFPALVQVADESGQPLSPPRPFSEAVVRQLDE